MSTDWSADLCFGFLLADDNLNVQINEGEIELPKEFEMSWAGDAFAGEMETFICIKKSHHHVVSWRENSTFLGNKGFTDPDPKWEPKLLEWAKEHGLKDPVIGWYLCTSIG